MRLHKFTIASAAVLAVFSMASVSFADDTKGSTYSAPSTSTTGTPSTMGTPSTSSPYSTTTTPSSSTTTTTTQGTLPPSSPPQTSTTTTTSAGEFSATATPPPMTMTPAPRESVSVYDSRRPNRPLLFTGGALLVGTYVTTAALAGARGPDSDHDLYIPVVGPWINVADRSCPPERTSCTSFDRDTALIVGSGVLQGIGAALAVTSIFVPEKIETARISAGPVKMHVVPSAGSTGAGIGAVGTF